MGLNRNLPARDMGYQGAVQCLRKRITYKDTAAVTIGVLPAGAVVVGGGIQVITAFADTGTDTVNIGTSGDGDAFATLLDVSSVGFKALDELATHDDYSDTAEVTVTAVYAGQNSNAAAGVGDVIVFYVTK